MKYAIIALVIAIVAGAVLFFILRPKDDPDATPDAAAGGYKQITQDEAKEMMKRDDGHVIVDVRRQDEFDSGHIPGAICIPNENIGDVMPEELPSLDQVILVYCRSGRRSKEASSKLYNIGYTNVYEFGGIIDWTGETVMEDEMEDKGEYETEEPQSGVPHLVIEANGEHLLAALEDNSSARELVDRIGDGEITLDLKDYGGFEKVGPLPWSLERNDEQITTEPGDVILYQGNQITIYYDKNTWSFTRLAKIEDATKAGLLSALGSGDVTVKMHIEWK